MSHLNGTVDQTLTLLLAQAARGVPAGARNCEAERVARAEAERLAQARADILAIVAHDLRNPLNVIASAVQLLLEEAPSPASGAACFGSPSARRPR